jgi:hypothetical protein
MQWSMVNGNNKAIDVWWMAGMHFSLELLAAAVILGCG